MRKTLKFLSAAILFFAAYASSADVYYDSTSHYLEAANWLEESKGDWNTMRWYLRGDDGDESCCSKFAESDPLYLDGTLSKVENEIIACRNLTRDGDHGDEQGTFHVRAKLYDSECGSGFRGFALYDFCDKDYNHPEGLREIIRFGIINDEDLVYRVAGDREYTEIHSGLLDEPPKNKRYCGIHVDEGYFRSENGCKVEYEVGVDFSISWVRVAREWPNDDIIFRFSLMDGYRERYDPEKDDWVPYRFDVKLPDDEWEVNAIGLIASSGSKMYFSSVYVNTDSDIIPGDLRASDLENPAASIPVRHEWQTEDGNYSIGSFDQFQNFMLTLEDYSFPNSRFTLISDIDCEGRDWIDASALTHFAGVFDGQGHIISNMTVGSEGSDYVGLFGKLSGTVKDVKFVNPVIKGRNRGGVLAGEILDGAHVNRCGVIGASVTTSGDYSGAFAGLIDGGANVSECFCEGFVVSSGDYAGGFAGSVGEGAAISDCYAVVGVTGNRCVGSFAGQINGASTSLERCYAACTASGTQDAGGFAGSLVSSPTFTDCFVQDPAVATDGVTALDAAGMRNTANFTAFHSSGHWTQIDGKTQPYFDWGLVEGKFILSGDAAIIGCGTYEPGTDVTISIVAPDATLLRWTDTAIFADPVAPTPTILLDNHRSVAATLKAGTSWKFDYTGAIQSFIAPCSGTYELHVWGAQGGARDSLYGGCGGLGGYASCHITLAQGETIYIYVGGQGGEERNAGGAGGWNGGGRGGAGYGRYSGSGGGGGATHISKVNNQVIGGGDGQCTSLVGTDYIIVAGGGGGASYLSTTPGTGGGTEGGKGTKLADNYYTENFYYSLSQSYGADGGNGGLSGYSVVGAGGGGGGYYGGTSNYPYGTFDAFNQDAGGCGGNSACNSAFATAFNTASGQRQGNGMAKIFLVLPETYTITYSLKGGSASNPASYDWTTATFTLENPTKEGRSFIGWTGSNGSTPQMTVTIPQGSAGNRSYTANWDGGYVAWADENGLAGAWDEKSDGICNVFRYVFDMPTGFADITRCGFDGSKIVVMTPEVANSEGVTVNVVESNDPEGVSPTNIQTLDSSGRTEFSCTFEGVRYYRLKATIDE